ncbi:hypothetical protein KP509_21G016900 [Ceratopteris richardii]|uniref:Photolyase/cryptochrome alpha/beta domain-containing protein n=1 Tax=Ceratopteris richardii TaxID=49495 RepID=A0A8T2SB16_CERRI|nr:hypothetical protein KP509_21G016900 [Ceratopteris richardii]
MATPLKELESLMDHATSRVGRHSAVLPHLPREDACCSSSLPALELNESEQSLETDALPHPQSHLMHSFASLSFSFCPSLSSAFVPSASLATSSNAASSTKALFVPPSAKKSASSASSLIPATSVATLATEIPSPAPSLRARRSSTAFPDYQRLPDKGNSFGEPSNGAAIRRVSIVWFRNDLRCHDNETLVTASKESSSILPVYCFDPRDYGKSSSGFDKTGPCRAKFLLECVSNLRERLRERGSDLVVRVGHPEEVLVKLASSIGADALYAHQEVSYEEVSLEKRVSAALQEQGVDVKYFWGSTLFHVEDLPFTLEETPTTYADFRDKIRGLTVRQALEAPKHLKGLPARGDVKPGDMPSIRELGLKPLKSHCQNGSSVSHKGLVGGEVEALRRLESFTSQKSKQSAKKIKNPVDGENIYGAKFSSKISSWLATGCLSPRCMFEGLNKSGERIVTAGSSNGSVEGGNGIDWLVFELVWRDFFRFITKKYAVRKENSDLVTASPVPA